LTSAEQYEGLEATGDNLRRILGDEGARKLAAAFGGRRLYVPRDPGEHHPISVALGREGAARLAGAFHGVGIDIPMLPATRAEVRALDAAGCTRADIARRLRITERWVYKILSEDEPARPRQGALF
jgi:Mor family transcriptional regulator